mmetsp:Transcript_21328/g.67469  ORF Transcript_21328/g.67469 Transcript_21328/m.67469 type:complete len:81 (-) Transcript_21328:369-611(-)
MAPIQDFMAPAPDRKTPPGPGMHMFMPLIYAPALPLMRIAMTKYGVPKERRLGIYLGGVFVVLSHAAYVMSNERSMGAGS